MRRRRLRRRAPGEPRGRQRVPPASSWPAAGSAHEVRAQARSRPLVAVGGRAGLVRLVRPRPSGSEGAVDGFTALICDEHASSPRRGGALTWIIVDRIMLRRPTVTSAALRCRLRPGGHHARHPVSSRLGWSLLLGALSALACATMVDVAARARFGVPDDGRASSTSSAAWSACCSSGCSPAGAGWSTAATSICSSLRPSRPSSSRRGRSSSRCCVALGPPLHDRAHRASGIVPTRAVDRRRRPARATANLFRPGDAEAPSAARTSRAAADAGRLEPGRTAPRDRRSRPAPDRAGAPSYTPAIDGDRRPGRDRLDLGSVPGAGRPGQGPPGARRRGGDRRHRARRAADQPGASGTPGVHSRRHRRMGRSGAARASSTSTASSACTRAGCAARRRRSTRPITRQCAPCSRRSTAGREELLEHIRGLLFGDEEPEPVADGMSRRSPSWRFFCSSRRRSRLLRQLAAIVIPAVAMRTAAANAEGLSTASWRRFMRRRGIGRDRPARGRRCGSTWAGGVKYGTCPRTLICQPSSWTRWWCLLHNRIPLSRSVAPPWAFHQRM